MCISIRRVGRDVLKGGSTTEDTQKFESQIRGEKYIELQKVFDGIVTEVAVEDEEKAVADLINCLINSMGVNNTQQFYDDILASSNEYIRKLTTRLASKTGNNSLVRRFSQDLFEIIINRAYLLDDRWQRFTESIENIYSLSMFADSMRASIKKGEHVRADNSPLVYSILSHNYNKETISTFTDQVIKIVHDASGCDVIPFNKEIFENAALYDKADLDTVLEKVTEAFTKFDKNVGDDTLQRNIIKRLENVFGTAPLSLEEKYEEAMKKRMEKHENATYETIKNALNRDIEILSEIVQTTLVNAIQLEKPFLANIVNAIDNLIGNCKRGDDFKNLISKLAVKIDAQKYELYAKEEAEAAVKRQVLFAIEKEYEEVRV